MARVRRPWTARLGAALRDEVDAEGPRALLASGASAYAEFLDAEQLRRELVAAGVHLRWASPAETGQLLAAWVAFALQTLAEAFLDSEAGAGGTPGFVSRATAAQVEAFARAVPVWSGRARRAAADPGYDLAVEVPLPAPLPGWVVVEPCPPAHLAAMRAATDALLGRVAGAVADLATATEDPEGVTAEVRGLLADVEARAESVGRSAGALAVHEATEDALRDVVSRAFVLGQLVSRPALLRRPGRPPDPLRAAASPPAAYPPTGPAGPAGTPWPYGGHGGYGHHGGHHGGYGH